MALVVACIEASTHYIDITGEVHWVAGMRSRYGATAAEQGVCLLSLCGYDCVPNEVSVLAAAARLPDKLVEAECTVVLDDGVGPSPL